MKPLVWIASSKKDLLAMPDEVQDVFGSRFTWPSPG
jgi:phage-related protein